MSIYFRVHPTINFARVGASDDYYIAPETAAGEIVDSAGLYGGLPIKRGTENTPITAKDFRDDCDDPLRQAARFRIYAFDQPQTRYPSEDPGREVKVGDRVGGRTIADIVWTVHLANKKNNNYAITSSVHVVEKGKYVEKGVEEGIAAYENGALPPLRNPKYGPRAALAERRARLVIDAGPRALKSTSDGSETHRFDRNDAPSYGDRHGAVADQPEYPVSFPSDHFKMCQPLGEIDSLGEMTIEKGTGRLIVVGGYGKASAIETDGEPPPLEDPIDNDGWFDDTSDGPVTAVMVFDDGSTATVVHGWVVCTDPGYAPQTRNVVSTWDDMFSAWVEKLALMPNLYAEGKYQNTFHASFETDVMPVFHGAFLQRWNTGLPSGGVSGHNYVGAITAADDPKARIPSFKELIRDPNNLDEDDSGVKMPLALGDAMRSFLALSPTQYFLLFQWYEGRYTSEARGLSPGEKLDRDVLENCLGGRYSPGIDLTFIVRDPHLYRQDWKGETGPFRVNLRDLEYSTAQKSEPFLGEGYVPLRDGKVEPGDLCKFMAQPWHTDYNSCATHTPDPNPVGNNTLYWSWPAQRPVSVYPRFQCTYDEATKSWTLGGQLYSVRGEEGHGTTTPFPQQQGRYQCYFDFVKNWHKVGFVIQGVQIADKHGGNYGSDKFLEVCSLYKADGDMVPPWPTDERDGYKAPKDCGPSAADCHQNTGDDRSTDA